MQKFSPKNTGKDRDIAESRVKSHNPLNHIKPIVLEFGHIRWKLGKQRRSTARHKGLPVIFSKQKTTPRNENLKDCQNIVQYNI
jgi:hypothetical protein